MVSYDRKGSVGYLLCRGDRLVWKVESAHLSWDAASLRWQTEMDHFIALGNTRGFLNGDFTWPPEDWVNRVTDEKEKAYAENNPLGKLIDRSLLYGE